MAWASIRIDLIAKADFGGLLFDRITSGSYRSDIESAPLRSRLWIEDRIREGAIVTLMGVPVGSGLRMGIDRNLDGILDGVRSPISLVIRLGTMGETIELIWNTEPDHAYTIDYSDSLTPDSWTPLATGIVPQDAVATFTDSIPGRGPFRFYRIRRD